MAAVNSRASVSYDTALIRQYNDTIKEYSPNLTIYDFTTTFKYLENSHQFALTFPPGHNTTSLLKFFYPASR